MQIKKFKLTNYSCVFGSVICYDKIGTDNYLKGEFRQILLQLSKQKLVTLQYQLMTKYFTN